jgi:putative transposase
VSTQARREVEAILPIGGMVGLDMGIARFVTLSDGSHFDPLSRFKKHQQRLRKYQRRMAKKVKFSQNWKKTKAKVTQVHIDIDHARKDYLHKASTTISQNHAIVCIEDLQIRNMSSPQKAMPKHTVKRYGKSLARIGAFSIKAGASFSANWTISWRGAVGI